MTGPVSSSISWCFDGVAHAANMPIASQSSNYWLASTLGRHSSTAIIGLVWHIARCVPRRVTHISLISRVHAHTHTHTHTKQQKLIWNAWPVGKCVDRFDFNSFVRLALINRWTRWRIVTKILITCGSFALTTTRSTLGNLIVGVSSSILIVNKPSTTITTQVMNDEM